MTAPGNAILLFSFLAVFAACSGYAVGRVHQWYRTEQDREVAYRDGYDMAARSTFSLAARIIGPRRDKAAVRASASVHTSVAAASPGGAGPVTASPAAAGPAAAGSAAANPAAVDRAASDPAAPVVRSDEPRPGLIGPARPGTAARPAGTRTPAGAAPPNWTPFPVPGVTDTTDIRPEVRAWSSLPATQVVPPAGPIDRTAPAPAGTGTEPDGAAPAEDQEPGGKAERHRRGRHFVPDELVRAATYRLSPDRVARAKVPEVEPHDENSRHPVPRPRTAGPKDD